MIKLFGSVTGVIGALMLASNSFLSPYGYVFFILSSLALTYVFIRDKDKSMIFNQGGFLAINIFGALQWLY